MEVEYIERTAYGYDDNGNRKVKESNTEIINDHTLINLRETLHGESEHFQTAVDDLLGQQSTRVRNRDTTTCGIISTTH